MSEHARLTVRKQQGRNASAATSATFAPLVRLLLAELEACGQAEGLRRPPRLRTVVRNGASCLAGTGPGTPGRVSGGK